jgi:hypothetical protein
MAVSEGETIPLGWFISVGGSSPSEVTEATTVIGTTVDRSGGDGNCEVLERHLSVQTTAQSAAAAVAAVAAKVAAVESAAKYAAWAAAVKAKAALAASVKAAAAAAAAVAKAESDRVAAVTQIVRAEFLRCGWVAAQQQVLWETGGPDKSHLPVDGEMYIYRRESQTEGYSLKDQGSSFFINTGYSYSETVVATHPRYDAAISAVLSTDGDLLTAVRLAMGDIVIPIAPPALTQEEILAKQAAELAVQKAANAARRQASRDAQAAELAAKKAARLKRYSAPEAAPAPAPISSSVNSVNLNDPWGSLSALKL